MTTPVAFNRVYFANPQADWENRRNIFWGTAFSNNNPQVSGHFLEKIREGIINHNFHSKESFIFTLGPIKTQKQSRSCIQIFESILGSMTKDQWINTAKIVAFVVVGGCLTVAITHCGVNFLTQCYDQMSRGLGIYNQYGWYIRPYDKEDFFVDCLNTVFLISLVFRVVIRCYEKLPRNSFFFVYTREKQPYRVVQELKQEPSSMSGFDLDALSNSKEGQMWLDPISTEEISETDICSTRILLIQKQAFDIKNVLRRIFVKSLQEGRIWHPYSNGYMDTQTQQKIVRDISAFFCISEEEFLNCWNIGIMTNEEVQNNPIADLIILARMLKFLELIPNETIRQNLNSILLQDQKRLLARLLEDPTFLENRTKLNILVDGNDDS